MDESHTVDVIFLDFAKAFDSFGLGDVAGRWLEAYLSGRVSLTLHSSLHVHTPPIPNHPLTVITSICYPSPCSISVVF